MAIAATSQSGNTKVLSPPVAMSGAAAGDAIGVLPIGASPVGPQLETSRSSGNAVLTAKAS